jgi:phosphoribosyl 1,2-cyclic phosphodiesterase
MFEISVLASGSSGNCFYIGSEKGDILVDAGISCRQVSKRLEIIGKNIQSIMGIFVTHEHIDHIRGLNVLSRRHNIPIFINKGTLSTSYSSLNEVNLFKKDEEIDLNGIKILPFSKSHDANDPVSFIIKNNDKKISVITDIGFCCENVKNAVKESDVIILESNHDISMLKNGPYPFYLKQRILGNGGHLSNYDAALAVLEHGNKKLQHVLLAHLSKINNTPQTALDTFNSIIEERSDLKKLKAWLTYREKPTELIRIE